jgi:hypothetical protein
MRRLVRFALPGKRARAQVTPAGEALDALGAVHA